jgi:hypothetical protein
MEGRVQEGKTSDYHGSLSYIMNKQDIPINSVSYNPNALIHDTIASDVTMETREPLVTFHSPAQEDLFPQQTRNIGQDPRVPPGLESAKVGNDILHYFIPF